MARISDWETINVKSHLGDLLKEGVNFIGYDLKRMNILENLNLDIYPDVILVKRQPTEKKKNNVRLKRLNI